LQTAALTNTKGKFLKLDMRKIYRFVPVEYKAGEALPLGGDIYYECGDCNGIVNSVPHLPSACECGNMTGNKGAITIKKPEVVTPVRGKLK